MKNRYKTIHKYGKDEVVINKSTFIGYASPIDTEDEALNFIESIKEKHKDAAHNVYGYVCGENSIIQRYSDDGEPSGTAGIPVLEVIKKEDLRNVVVVVTRYFGGIKLGAGGLVRAYTKGAKIGLDAGNIIDKVLYKRIKARTDYTLYGKIENELNNRGYVIENVIYDDKANFIILCDGDKFDELNSLLIEITSSRIAIDELGEEYLSVKNGELIK